MEKAYVRTHNGTYKTTIQIRNHTIVADEPESGGGENAGPMPPEILAGAIGSCMAMTAIAYARRKEWPLEDVEIEIAIERFDGADYADYDGNEPFVHEIREKVVLHGPLDEQQKKRIMQIAAKCPVRRVLKFPQFFIEEFVDEIITAEAHGETLPE
ncbi:MAG: OsmC family peroxiredoxin [Chloroflexi bacterium]|nr:MAG: OsmC family peroxiredoxin [Chloroflexota bacterium]